jgi:hypothetical protein
MNIGQIYETVLVGLDKTWVENMLPFDGALDQINELTDEGIPRVWTYLPL